MLTARLGAALPSIGGDWLLPSFLAPVLGGVLLSGGTVSIVGTFLGATLVTTIQNGLLLLEVGNFWIQFFLGLILLAAVMLDRYRSVLGERRRHRRP
jgi:ribose transport system permease protein